MTYEGWVTIGVVVSLIVMLIKNVGPSDVLFVGAATILTLAGVITADEAVSGFSNAGMLTVAFMFIVAAGLRETGVLDQIGHRLLGTTSTINGALSRISVVVLPMSAFLNNTPVVAMFVPIVMDWCRRNQFSPSKMLIPLSYLAILGGTLTLIGTSTNLVVNGLMMERGLEGMPLFEISKIGIPYAIIGTIYLFVATRFFLPDRKELFEQLGETRREYLAEMLVEENCRLAGQTVETAGLRKLPGLFLIEINRRGETIGPVGPDQRIEAFDRLVFTGIVSSIIELDRITGLIPVTDPHYEVSPQQQRGRKLCEAVISINSPLIGKTVREADFRATYGAAVVAVHRGGHRVESKVGEIRLRPGDTLLLQTGSHFLRAHRNDPAFYLVSDVDDWRALRRDRMWVSVALFAVLLVLMTAGFVETTTAAAAVAVLMIATGCLSAGDARKSIEWQVLITIAAAFGIGRAIENSGVAELLANQIVDWTQAWGPIAALAAIYLLTMAVTELITNNAAAVLIFPFCIKTAEVYEVSPMPFLMALILAASASFITPIGYQTNMMVFGPGGYRFSDFIRAGMPISVALFITATVLIPMIWPF
ncbi:MAG: SLC13 family permease [Pirellulaceae bacterium]